MRRNKSDTDERGVALVVVLWVVTLLAVIAASFTYSTRVETRRTTNLVGQAQGRALARAGVTFAALELQRPVQRRRLPSDGTPYRWQFGDAKLRITAVDVAGLIDLNAGSRPLLKGVLTTAGVPKGRRKRLVDAIVDWRDTNEKPQLNGAEREAYQAAGLPYGPKDAPFDSVAELQQVLGIDRALYQRLASRLTVFSGQSEINPRLAPAEVLRVLPGADRQAIRDFITARRQAGPGKAPIPPTFPGGGGLLSEKSASVYRVRVQVEVPRGTVTRIEATIAPQGANPRSPVPYKILEWREGVGPTELSNKPKKTSLQ